MSRRLLVGVIAVPAALAVAALVAAFLLGSSLAGKDVSAQVTQRSSMEQRLDQVIRVLETTDSCSAATTAIDDGMEILYGGLRPLPSKGEMLNETTQADRMISAAEMKLADALNDFAQKGKCEEQRGRALDLKLFIEQMNEVAEAVGKATAQCGVGDTTDQSPCDELHTLLDEEAGQVTEPRSHGAILHPSYSVKLRSPFVPPWFGSWEEDVVTTEPISAGQCVVIFKETKGLMLRLHLERIILVTDPWVSVFGAARGTKVPIWRLEWVPSEYVKEWNICNADGRVQKTVTQRVKQDMPLNFFWRFYPRAGK